jgi:hypothetical protein
VVDTGGGEKDEIGKEENWETKARQFKWEV